ncbi:hypothetical protein FRE64_07680 [Euhalothece natronophila Z-M001]|uniref:Uncharacterized protein n=1 Tax=Euhalothece natronophila Z-M001 TaxID=522448 RepID=A0A5B8NKQ6_9CHRO|nr:hypothetical protein [Euhalothece natronophila]QDZ39832.1 hypothetical protein FRE64_07680 [Euhalothece natronophila Z-M001]
MKEIKVEWQNSDYGIRALEIFVDEIHLGKIKQGETIVFEVPEIGREIWGKIEGGQTTPHLSLNDYTPDKTVVFKAYPKLNLFEQMGLSQIPFKVFLQQEPDIKTNVEAEINQKTTKPPNSNISLKRTENSLEIIVPAPGLTKLNLLQIGLGLAYPIIGLCLIILIELIDWMDTDFLFWMLFLIVGRSGITLIVKGIKNIFRGTTLSVNEKNFTLKTQWKLLWKLKYEKFDYGKTAELKNIHNTEEMSDSYFSTFYKTDNEFLPFEFTPYFPKSWLDLSKEMKHYAIAINRPYSERKWLKEQINEFVLKVHKEIASDPNSSFNLLPPLARDQDRLVRQKVASNPNTPSPTLQLLAQDQDKYVREQANGSLRKRGLI